MTSVTVTNSSNTVVVTESTGETAIVTAPSPAVVVTAAEVGPQGPKGDPGSFLFDDAAKVNGSLIYYDQASSEFKADATWTTSTIVDGANF
jgi:hypothetical protein